MERNYRVLRARTQLLHWRGLPNDIDRNLSRSEVVFLEGVTRDLNPCRLPFAVSKGNEGAPSTGAKEATRLH
jgi:hypothetical protein